jgi:hypothetical protein
MFGFKSSVTTPQPAVLVVDIGGLAREALFIGFATPPPFSSGSYFGPTS